MTHRNQYANSDHLHFFRLCHIEVRSTLSGLSGRHSVSCAPVSHLRRLPVPPGDFLRKARASGLLIFVMLALTISSFLMRPAWANPPPSEQELIDQLIQEVGQMNDVTFIRNGSDHDAKEAADHLRQKMHYFEGEIHTADDFIRLCATHSELSGLPYKVREADGTVRDSAPFLHDLLLKLRQQVSVAP